MLDGYNNLVNKGGKFMNALKRAFLYVIRKRGKSLLLGLILFIVTTLVLCGFASLDAEAKQSEDLRGTTGSGFTLKSVEKWGDSKNNGSGNFSNVAATEPITKKMIEKIMELEGIKANSANYYTMLAFYNKAKAPYKNDFGNPPMNSYPFNTFQGYGCTNTEYSSWFLSRELELAEGRHITSEDKRSIMISKKLADKLGLKVGDTINTVIDPTGKDPYSELEIVGLFNVLVDEEDQKNKNMSNITTDDLYGGYSYYWFADMNSMEYLARNYTQDGPANGYSVVDFYVNDPEKLESIIKEVQNISEFNWDNYEIVANDEVYERTANSMSDMSFLIQMLIVVIVMISMGIITLILTMWIKSRTKETGILLAGGISKTSILIQHFMEVGMIAIFSFPLAYLFSKTVAGNIAGIFNQAVSVSVTINHFVIVCSVGTILLIFAILISSIQTLRMKPKDILSKMS